MGEAEAVRIAELLAARNRLDLEIALVTNRPVSIVHLGEWIASRVFDIELDADAVNPAVDGTFRSGELAGKSVNVKWYVTREGLLDLNELAAADYYLVLAGPKSASIRGGIRPWCFESVHLFESGPLVESIRSRGLRIATAASIRVEQWDDAEIFPVSAHPALVVTEDQAGLLRLFKPEM